MDVWFENIIVFVYRVRKKWHYALKKNCWQHKKIAVNYIIIFREEILNDETIDIRGEKYHMIEKYGFDENWLYSK